MSEQSWVKFDWGSVLGAIALLTGAVCILGTPAEAVPAGTKDFKIAQVGVTSQVNAPIPLNLRPRTHIPLPTNSRSSDYESRFRYNDHYGYGDEYEHHRHHHRGNKKGDTIIIINPANHSNYSSYESYSDQDGYIRIIREQVVK